MERWADAVYNAALENAMWTHGSITISMIMLCAALIVAMIKLSKFLSEPDDAAVVVFLWVIAGLFATIFVFIALFVGVGGLIKIAVSPDAVVFNELMGPGK